MCISILIMILLVSSLILVHEIGHFIAARMCGVKVVRFGFGMPFGPEVKLFRWGDTDFYLHAFLLGGYVSFVDEAEEKDENTKDEEMYENKTISQKLFIVSAGVLMNIIFAIFLVLFSATIFQKLPSNTQDIFVNGFSENITSNIQKIGIQKDDKFLQANNIDIKNLNTLLFMVRNSRTFDDYAQEDLIEKKVIELKKINTNLEDLIKQDSVIKLPQMTPENPLNVNSDVVSGYEKYKKDGIKLSEAQINLRDELYDKKEYKLTQDTSIIDIASALADTYKPLEIKIERDGKEIVLENIIIDRAGLLGVLLKIDDIYIETKTPKAIIKHSFDYIYTSTKSMLYGLWQLFARKIEASNMHGIIAIVKVGGDVIAQKGMLGGILLTALISLNLAIMNLLPIPALDGGHIAFLIIEKITGKKPSKEFAEKLNNFFIMLLMALMLLICYNDIFALITKKF